MRRGCVLLATLKKMRKRALRIHSPLCALTKTLLFSDFQQRQGPAGNLERHSAEPLARHLPDDPLHLQVKQRSQNLGGVQPHPSTMSSMYFGSSLLSRS